MINKSKISEYLFFVSFIVIVLFNFLEQTLFIEKLLFIKIVGNTFIKISCGLLLVKYILDTFPVNKKTLKKEIKTILLIVIGLIVSYSSTGTYVIMPIIFLMINIKNMDIHQIIKVWLIQVSILTLVTVFSYLLGFIGEHSLLLRDDGTIRHSLGFAYSTFSANYSLYITIFFLYLRKDKIKYIEIIMLLFLNMGLYLLTNTKAAFAYSILSLIFATLIKKFEFKTAIRWINRYSIIVASFISMLLSYSFRFRFYLLEVLNQVLTGRLYLGSKAFDDFPITLFGHSIEWQYSGEGFNFIDSSYLSILFSYGIVSLILIIFGYYLVSFTQIANNIHYTALIIIISLHAMFDPQLIAIMYNPSILFLGYILYKNFTLPDISLLKLKLPYFSTTNLD